MVLPTNNYPIFPIGNYPFSLNGNQDSFWKKRGPFKGTLLLNENQVLQLDPHVVTDKDTGLL